MDVYNLFIIILFQIVLSVSEKSDEAGNNIKSLTEKACKLSYHNTILAPRQCPF